MKSLELALRAARLYQSPITRFIHYFENTDFPRDAIPVYENFCFALALFRTKTAEQVLEAKALLERLFAFQTEEGFPLYLHDYPQCYSAKLISKLALVARFLFRDFSSVLGEKLKERLEGLAVHLKIPTNPQTPEEWAELLIHSQLGQTPSFHLWDQEALCFTGSQKQRGGEPEVTLLDLILAEWTGKYSARALQSCPAHLQGALIFPNTIALSTPEIHWTKRFWGEDGRAHSAVLTTKGAAARENLIELAAKEVHDEVESSFFFNRALEGRVTVRGSGSTTFQLDEPVVIKSGGRKFKIMFSLQEGKGKFWGHICFGNRPGQVGSLQYEAFDWQIALRTIERTERCLIKVLWEQI